MLILCIFCGVLNKTQNRMAKVAQTYKIMKKIYTILQKCIENIKKVYYNITMFEQNITKTSLQNHIAYPYIVIFSDKSVGINAIELLCDFLQTER